MNTNFHHLLFILKEYENKIFPVFKFLDDNNDVINKFKFFIETNKDYVLNRELKSGHITASALVVDKNLTQCLMTFHKKLHKWLQLGGHADGNSNIAQVALQESREESGIFPIHFLSLENFPNIINIDQAIPFDLDIHFIPKNKNVPEHYHYDFRYLMLATEKNFFISPESLDLKWISIHEISNFTHEKSTLRQFLKLKHLISEKKFLLNKIKEELF